MNKKHLLIQSAVAGCITYGILAGKLPPVATLTFLAASGLILGLIFRESSKARIDSILAMFAALGVHNTLAILVMLLGTTATLPIALIGGASGYFAGRIVTGSNAFNKRRALAIASYIVALMLLNMVGMYLVRWSMMIQSY